VRHVRAHVARAFDRTSCGEHGCVNVAEFRPRGGDLHRVDDEPLLRQCLQAARVVAVGQPVVDALLGCDHRAVCASTTIDHGESRVDDLVFAVVEHDQRAVGAVAAMAALSLDRVVKTQHGRRGVRANRLAHRLDAVGEGRKEVRGLASHGCHVVGAQPRACHHAERAFATNEHRRDIGPVRCGRSAAGADHRAIGEHDFETDDHLVDLPVTSRELPGAEAGDPTADGGDVERLRKVPDGQSVFLELMLEIRAERAGQDFDDTRRSVDGHHAGHRRHVEHHAAEHRYRRSAHTAATGSHGDRHVVCGTRPHHALHFGGVARRDDCDGKLRYL